MAPIQVIGHKNPDTDATLSAIIAADFLEKKGYQATPYIQGPLNNETRYLLATYAITEPEIQTSLNPEQEVCLVDHNEASQSPDNIEDLTVTWLIDHHKMHFSSAIPLTIRTEPVCSTASVLYNMYRENDFEISQQIATMMLACIMSDSLLWKSPTTTNEDKAIAAELQKIAQIDSLEDFAMPMFEAKSDLGDISARELIQYDYKNFEFGDTKIGVGTLETTNPEYALNRKDEVLTGMQELKKEEHLDFIMLSIVDILGETNTTIVLDEDSTIVEEVFHTSVVDNLAGLGGRLSRKKQIMPDLTAYFST